MPRKKKDQEIKVEFVPGCFDRFEGTQEELNDLMSEIRNMFEGKTEDEIKSMGRRIDPNEMDPDEMAQIEAMMSRSNDRKLQ